MKCTYRFLCWTDEFLDYWDIRSIGNRRVIGSKYFRLKTLIHILKDIVKSKKNLYTNHRIQYIKYYIKYVALIIVF